VIYMYDMDVKKRGRCAQGCDAVGTGLKVPLTNTGSYVTKPGITEYISGVDICITVHVSNLH